MIKYITESTYVDLETGECINVEEAQSNYYIVEKEKESKIRIINKPGQQTLKLIIRKYITKLRPINQTELWNNQKTPTS